ncbi:MAG: PIN domain-containing protein [Acidobacteriota bacterium]|nr:PIN domain-containing protein [Acidobacteriota bacterium]
MSRVFVDTSAIYALLVVEDDRHDQAKSMLASLQQEPVSLVSTSFVVQEATALLQARIGILAVRTFHQHVVPAIEIEWVESVRYERAMLALLAANSREVSLTDWTSFDCMRQRGIDRAFAFDTHFAAQGFTLVS